MSNFQFNPLMRIKWLRYLIVGCTLCQTILFGQVSAEVITGKEAQTGLHTWEWTLSGISIQLVQRAPDQTRAFFLARGFSSTDADTIGQSCVFQTIFRNDGKQSLTYDLSDWKIMYQGKPLALQTRERWEERWLAKKVNQATRIAFNWSLLPTRQGFEPGDYNWGMISFGLPPGASLDLSMILIVDGKPIRAEMPSIVCADEQQ